MLARPLERQSRRLVLNWQGSASRAIMPVAELIECDGAFEFGYLLGATRAQQHGFNPFLAFPDLTVRYRSTRLFPFFANRVLPTTRPDYPEYLRAFGLEPSGVSQVELLGRSEGRRQTDKIETVLEPRRDPSTGAYVTWFLIRGIRHVAGAEDVAERLVAGAELQLQPEPANSFDPRARQLLDSERAAVGYVPHYLLADFEALESAGSSPRLSVERVNLPPHPVHHRVLVRAVAEWPDGFRAFTDPELAPLVARAMS